MKVNLKNSVFVITGTLSLMKRDEAEAAIIKAGGSIAKSVTQKTTHMIVGKNPSSKYTKAKNMGVPILTEEDFQALLAGKTVEVEEVGAAGERSVDELLGEVRSVMQGAPTSEMWDALVTLVDACRAEDVHVLTGYIDGYIARWTEESMKGLVGSSQGATQRKDRAHMVGSWYRSNSYVRGELRVAPEHWIGEMQQGVDSPKYKLVRALNVRATKMTSTAIVNVMNHPALEHLERLMLPTYTSLSKSLAKAICASETITYLCPGRVDPKFGPAFVACGKEPSGIKDLDLRNVDLLYSMRHDSQICEFLHAPCFDNVQTLHMNRSTDIRYIKEAERCGLLPGVRHLHIAPYEVSFVKDVLLSEWVRAQVTHITFESLFFAASRAGEWDMLRTIDYGSGRLHVLDMSVWHYDAKEHKAFATFIAEAFSSMPLLDHVDTLILGKLATPKLVETLLEKHPDMTIV